MAWNVALNIPPLPNPIGVNLPAGGTSGLYFEDFPVFQDAVLSANQFQYASGPGVTTGPAATLSGGWPTQDFYLLLHSSANAQSWMGIGSTAFGCGFTGTGNEVITATGTCTVNKTSGAGNPNVRFDLQATGAGPFGFTVTGTTGGVTNLFAYLPAYRAQAANGYSLATLVTNEFVSLYGKLGHLRGMDYQNAWLNVGPLYNLKAQASVGATSATLATGFGGPPGTYNFIFHADSGTQNPDVRAVTIASTGQTSISWTGGLNYASSTVFPPNGSWSRNTPANTKCNKGWHNGGTTYQSEGYPVERLIDAALAAGMAPYIHMPANFDSTYLSDVASVAFSKVPAGTALYIEYGNENWNGSGNAYWAINGLATQAGITADQYIATQLHTIAAEFRSVFGSRYGTDVRLVCASQTTGAGTTHFKNQLAYMVGQGWTPKNDIWRMETAPYLNPSPAVINTDTEAQILTKLTTGSGSQWYSSNVETHSFIARAYQFAGGFGTYEQGWDVLQQFGVTGNPNYGAALVDTALTPIFVAYQQGIMNAGVQVSTHFKGGVSSSNSSHAPDDEFSTSYSGLLSSGCPILAALQNFTSGYYTPTRNVVAKSGDQVDWRNYLDAAPGASYPTFTASSNISPLTNYNIGCQIYVPSQLTATVKCYFTTTASSSFNLIIDGVQVATGVTIPNGLNGTLSAPVSFATVTLSAGFHSIDMGAGAAATGVTANVLEFD